MSWKDDRVVWEGLEITGCRSEFIPKLPKYGTVILTIAGSSGRVVCGSWPAETVGSNPPGGMDVCPF